MIVAAGDHRRHGGDELWRVLVVGMHHDDDVAAVLDRQPVAILLVATVAEVGGMPVDDSVGQRLCDPQRLVVTGVIDHDHEVHDLLRHRLVVGPPQRGLRVVGGHHHDDFSTFVHGRGSGRRDREIRISRTRRRPAG